MGSNPRAQYPKPTAVVLGATGGVGLSITVRLHEAGFNVIGFHRGSYPAVATQLEEIQGIDMITQDAVRDITCVQRSVDTLDCRPIDLLVHATSGAAVGTARLLDYHKVEGTFNRLAHSFLWWAQELDRRKQFVVGAHCIALSSPCVDFYLRNSGVIGPAKAALESYVKTLAVEFMGMVRVNCVRFSTVETPALKKVVGEEAMAKLHAIHEDIVPFGHMMEPQDVARIVLAVHQQSWLNGAIIDATGGATLTLMDRAFYGGV